MPAKTKSTSGRAVSRTSQAAGSGRETVLLAVTGLSPAIITETLWALAKEKPAILPNRVVFITTGVGKKKIQEQLLSPVDGFGGATAWEALRAAVKASDHELIAEAPRVIGQADRDSGTIKELPDIVSPEDNQVAAAFILEEVRRIVENPDRRLIASIAGGRKTMGALLHAAVSLIGREDDRLTHVLVSAPYETMPGFFFPGQPGSDLLDRDRVPHPPAKAKVSLADVPFVPLRNRFRELDDMPGNFEGLRKKFSRALQRDAEREIPIGIDHGSGLLTIDGTPMKCRPKILAILEFVLLCNRKKSVPPDGKIAAEAFLKWHATNAARLGRFSVDKFDASDITHELSELRGRLKNHTWQPAKGTFRQAPFRLEAR